MIASNNEVFTPHSVKQEELIFSDSDITLSATGTQWGKSLAGTLWICRQIHKFSDKKDNFLIGAPTYKILQQSVLPYFLEYMGDKGHYNKSDAIFRIKDGGTVYFRTETDPESIVGIPNVRAGWLDEAGMLRLYFWENYQARMASRGARTLLTTSPYALNWIYHQFIKPVVKEGKKIFGLKVIQAASWENPHHSLSDPAKRLAIKEKMDARRFDMLFGGKWGQMSGLVFDCFDESLNQVEEFNLPNGTMFVSGIDWGYTEPFVHIVRAVTPDGRHYQVSEFYKTGMTPTEQIDLIIRKTKLFGIKRHWCGHEQPGLIEELNRRFHHEKILSSAQAASFDITRGNGLHYELISTRRYKVFKGSSPHTLDEYSTYHYPEPKDLKPDQNAKDMTPVGQFDHCMSANRFVTIHEYRSQSKFTSKVPDELVKQESHSERIERLKRSNKIVHTENWS